MQINNAKRIMDTALCTLSLVLACRIDDFPIGKFEDDFSIEDMEYTLLTIDIAKQCHCHCFLYKWLKAAVNK